jgi:predicted nucleic acid-binding protein
VAIVVLDASVAIAFLDAGDRHHRGAVAALTRLQGSDMVLPASASAEMLVGPARRSRAAMDAAREFVIDLALRVEPISAGIAERAAELRAAHRALKLPDALVIATADALEAALLLTADRTWTRVSRRAQMI